MKTLLKLGPKDHGRPLTLEEFDNAAYQDGYQYELIDGRLYVAPEADAPQGVNEHWLWTKVFLYSLAHQDVINFVYNKTRLFVPGHPELTIPEPDLAAYHHFPLRQQRSEINWEQVSPILVVEILATGGEEKDLVRNVGLYLQVPSIREYWILDGRRDPDNPTMLVYRRRGNRWQQPIEIQSGETYTTRLLPGFTLILDPHA